MSRFADTSRVVPRTRPRRSHRAPHNHRVATRRHANRSCLGTPGSLPDFLDGNCSRIARISSQTHLPVPQGGTRAGV